MDESELLLNGMIDCIKLVRSCSTLGLADAKKIVEAWGNRFGFAPEYRVYSFPLIKALLRAVGQIERKEWSITSDSIRIEREIQSSDWLV
jgi:hypothetical protein